MIDIKLMADFLMAAQTLVDCIKESGLYGSVRIGYESDIFSPEGLHMEAYIRNSDTPSRYRFIQKEFTTKGLMELITETREHLIDESDRKKKRIAELEGELAKLKEK